MQKVSPPFAGCAEVCAVLPRPAPGLDEDELTFLDLLPRRFTDEAGAMARELGAPVRVVDVAPPEAPVWYIGPRGLNPALAALDLPDATGPVLHLDRDQRRLVSDAPDLDGVLETFSALRSLSRHPGGPLPVGACHTLTDAVTRVLTEVHDSWAGFFLDDIDWPGLSRRHIPRVRGASTPAGSIRALQAWLAELGDFHTWVRPAVPQLVLPYGACVVGGEVVLTHVLPWTAGWAAGARPGFRLVGQDVRGMWETTPAAPHSKPLLVARRLLSGGAGERRHLEARGPGGAWVRWSEVFEPPTGPVATWEVLPSGDGFLWIGAWLPGLGVEETIAEAFEALQGCPRLIVDLRGNSGGRLTMAHAFRDRFLPDRRVCGWIRHTEPGRRLGPWEAIMGEPSSEARWTRPVCFLTSPLSYSSSEDALLGLQGLPNVTVMGEPSGGGSGRNRRLRLFPGWRLTISTAITWDVRGRRVERRGIPVDRPVVVDRAHPDGGDRVLGVAMG